MSKPSVRLWSNLTAQRVFASLKVTSPLSAFICPVFISEFNFPRSCFLGSTGGTTWWAPRSLTDSTKCWSSANQPVSLCPLLCQVRNNTQKHTKCPCIYWTPTVLGTFLRYICSFIFTSSYRPATMYQDLPDTRNIKIHMTLSCSL